MPIGFSAIPSVETKEGTEKMLLPCRQAKLLNKMSSSCPGQSLLAPGAKVRYTGC